MTYEEAKQSIIEDGINLGGYGDYIDFEALPVAAEALEKVEQLEEENKEIKSALNKFCAEFLCRECLFLDKENEQCTIAKLLL